MEAMYQILYYTAVVIGVTIILGIVIAVFQHLKVKLPYKKKEFLLNISERKFFEAISEKLPSKYVIYPQIVLSAIIKTECSKRNFWFYQNKINKKIIDFVICEKRYNQPILAIEYDGPTHERYDRRKRDDFVNKALESAEIKIIHVKHSKNLNYDKVMADINNNL